jgi:hypothetical protein
MATPQKKSDQSQVTISKMETGQMKGSLMNFDQALVRYLKGENQP